jgi:hypothetical protein
MIYEAENVNLAVGQKHTILRLRLQNKGFAVLNRAPAALAGSRAVFYAAGV